MDALDVAESRVGRVEEDAIIGKASKAAKRQVTGRGLHVGTQAQALAAV